MIRLVCRALILYLLSAFHKHKTQCSATLIGLVSPALSPDYGIWWSGLLPVLFEKLLATECGWKPQILFGWQGIML